MGELQHKDMFDIAGRGISRIWRYDLLHTDFTAGATTETKTLDPLVESGETLSGGGVIIQDAFILLHTAFAGPNITRLDLQLGDATNGVHAYLDDVQVQSAGHGTLGLKGNTVAEKGDLLVDAAGRSAGATPYLAEAVAITCTLDTNGTDNLSATTAGRATLCIVYYEIPSRLP